MPYKHFLPGLSEREQIADALLRACLAIDSNDRALWDSAWAAETPAELSFTGAGHDLRGFNAVTAGVLGVAGPLDTHHLITNIRVDYEDGRGADTASLTAYFQNQHFRGGEGPDPAKTDHFMGAGTYDVTVVREPKSGQWRMQDWAVKVTWTQGNPAVVQPSA